MLRDEDIHERVAMVAGKLEKFKIFHIRKTKTGKEREIPIHPYVLEELEKWIPMRNQLYPGTQWLFPSPQNPEKHLGEFRKTWKSILRKARISEHFVPHDMRHCFATRLVRAGANVVDIKELMGHKNIETTMRYTNPKLFDLNTTLKMIK